MDPLDFMTDEQLLQIFHCKKTELSCIEQPHTFLNQLRDHDLIPEDKYKKVMGSKTKHNREIRLYEMLSWFETKGPKCVKLFWKCVFKDHILQQYPVLQLLQKSLLDGSFSFPEKPLEKETTPEDLEVSSKKVKKAKVQKEGKGKEGVKKKEKEAAKGKQQNGESDDDEEQPGCSSQPTPTKKRSYSRKGVSPKKPTYGPSMTRDENKNFWNWPIYKTQLPVVCGKKTGTLYRDKLAKGEKCILAEKRWLYPKDFEVLAGKENCKNWKTSIRCRNTTLYRLIQEGHLKCANYKRQQARSSQSHQGRRHDFLSSLSEASISVSDSELDEEEEEGHLQAVQESTEETSEGERSVTEGSDEMDLSIFKGDSLSVTCGSAKGTLYKYRFASGICGKCIRTEDKWLTPEDFTKEDPSLSNPHWTKSIHCHGTPLSFLVKKRILQVHSLLCKSECCSKEQNHLKNQENDDECFVCSKNGEILCCDRCPRAFHYLCHLPVVDKEIVGDKWICTYCVLKESQQWRYQSQLTFQAALQSLVSDFMLHCQYLLLCLYHADKQCVFTANPCNTVTGYSSFIKHPMWLDKVAENLEQKRYRKIAQFHSDIQLIFDNCAKFNRDNDFGKMGAKLRSLFEEEFHKIFGMQS